jgi:hypothetical protein
MALQRQSRQRRLPMKQLAEAIILSAEVKGQYETRISLADLGRRDSLRDDCWLNIASTLIAPDCRGDCLFATIANLPRER